MKKFLMIVFMMVLVITICGCGKETASNVGANETIEEEEVLRNAEAIDDGDVMVDVE